MELFHQVLLGPDDAVLSDELNHASIIDGIRLCRAKRLRYKHMDLSDLESKLKESQVCVDLFLCCRRTWRVAFNMETTIITVYFSNVYASDIVS